jgi:hypothetical protein
MRGVTPVRTSTILSPPVGSFDPENGHIAVKVMGGTAAPLLGVPVHVTGPGYDANLVTTADGCAFFAFVPPETYTVALGSVGYVDRQGSPTASQVTGVSSGATSSIAFDYDQAASLTLTLTAPDGGTFPADLPVSLGNTGLLPTGSKPFAGTGSVRTVANLFPYSDGYSVWAGSCSDADPEGEDGSGVAFWEGATRESVLETPPAGSASGPVPLRTVQVSFVDLAASGQTYDVMAVHPPDNGCPGGEQYTVATFTGSGVADVALPYGTWTFEVADATPNSGAWPAVTIDPRIPGSSVVSVEVL